MGFRALSDLSGCFECSKVVIWLISNEYMLRMVTQLLLSSENKQFTPEKTSESRWNPPLDHGSATKIMKKISKKSFSTFFKKLPN